MLERENIVFFSLSSRFNTTTSIKEYWGHYLLFYTLKFSKSAGEIFGVGKLNLYDQFFSKSILYHLKWLYSQFMMVEMFLVVSVQTSYYYMFVRRQKLATVLLSLSCFSTSWFCKESYPPVGSMTFYYTCWAATCSCQTLKVCFVLYYCKTKLKLVHWLIEPC